MSFNTATASTSAARNASGIEAGESETAVRFYTTPRDTWAAMLDDCRNAQKSIAFEQYIVMDDDIGNEFLETFAVKASQGVQVRLLLDRVGSRAVFNSPHIAKIRQLGGKVHFYNPVTIGDLLSPGKWLPRNHTKMLIVDDAIAYIGSVCIDRAMENWRDLQMRITGPILADMMADFTQVWIRVSERASKLRSCFSRADRDFRYVVHRPRYKSNPIYRELLSRIRNARHNVYLVTPYFLPPRKLQSALRAAARRGVDVSVMMNRKSDVPVADCVSHSYFPRMMRNGIKVFMYQEPVLHAKYAIIDDDWATVGSTNMDYLSLLKNRESNIIITDRPTVAALHENFARDMAKCQPVTMAYWRGLPLAHRVAGYIGRVFKKFL